MMIGQSLLLNKLNNLTLDTMPRSLILFGEEGCGKHTYCNLMSDKLGLPLVNITEIISLDYINEMYSRVTPTIYIIEASGISIKEQNMLLKFIEEPLKNSYIIILCESKNSLLPTILNRCNIWNFEQYSREELNSFNVIDSYLIANTPGQILNLKSVDIEPIVKLVDSIIEKMKNASFTNALSISNKIAFKDEKDKIPLKLFNKVFLNRLSLKIKENQSSDLLGMYKIVSQYLKDSNVPKIDAKILLDNLIVNLWEVTHY